jgi:cellulose synthase/poly-beta-1,6-N-acetylglucosamine synthase-like glycosyltransferase/peptidoglycan/xylan/chitin deacetylase (PgdA/CDA1 family)/spore germination protein YaaH
MDGLSSAGTGEAAHIGHLLLDMTGSSGNSGPPSRFIFFDPHGRRWPRFRRATFWAALLGASILTLFVAAVWIRPSVRIPPIVRELKGRLKAERATAPAPDAKAVNWQRYVTQSKAAQERLARLQNKLGSKPRQAREIRLGFYVDWDTNSVVSLHEHANDLTHLAPEWLTVSGIDSKITAESDPGLRTFSAAHGITLMPTLRNLVGDSWQPEAVEILARAGRVRQQAFAAQLAKQLRDLGAGGVILDFNGLDPALRRGYTSLCTAISDALHGERMELWFAVSMDDELQAYDFDGLSEVVDHFVALLFDEHTEGAEPGPIASQEWLDGWLEVMKGLADPDQWIAVLGSYAYDWNTTRHDMESISFRDAMSRASYAGVEQSGGIELAAPTYNGRYNYSDDEGQHEVWFLDSIAFYNQLRAVRKLGVAGVGVFRLGTEDPMLWSVLSRNREIDADFLAQLSDMHSDRSVTHVGRGEVVSVDTTHDDGKRTITREPDGKLRAEYTDAPTYPTLYHQGAGDKNLVTITFDDGPDPEWTPQILDILKARGVKATFFVVGRNAEDHPDLIRRIVAEGHLIGNHTYTHGNLAEMPEWRMRLEVDGTERLIESITGRSLTLFRPPYNADATPGDVAELYPLAFVQGTLGYTVVLEKIDPQDWAQPGTDVILQRIKEQRHEGNIILLHDAGGDRSETVEALPHILDWLEERGDRIVSLSELLNIPRDDLMPIVKPDAQSGWRTVAATGFRTWHWVVETLWAFMILATSLVVVRSLLIAWLAWRHRHRTEANPPTTLSDWPAVSVLIAAYNEGKVIAKTLHSVLDTDYAGEIEVVVVDDGSKDNTVAEVERVVAEDSRVRLITQANAGKSAALRRAIANSKHGVIVFLDADTMFERTTIRLLVVEFGNPLVAAVSGHARVGNAHNFVTHSQALEYICGFNLDRRAYTEWNCVTVVPGAISAFRRSAIEAAGGFSHDTLAEDTDMTLTLQSLGFRVAYAADAVAWTEAPETWKTLAKQRFRWGFGTMQCLWKHRDLTFDPRYRALGMFALPSAWFFHFFLVAIIPFADAILLWSIFTGYASSLIGYFAIFLIMDLFLATLACWLEREPMWRAMLIVPMRFAYRWLLGWVIWKSILRAMRGALVGWGKLERTGRAVRA